MLYACLLFLRNRFLYLLLRKPIFLVAWIVRPFAGLVRLFKKSFLAGKTFPGWWGFLLACLRQMSASLA